MFVLSCLVIAFLLLDMPCLYNIGGALILVCVPCSPKHPSRLHTSRGEPVYILERRGLRLLNFISHYANPVLSSIHQKGGDCKGIFIPKLFWWLMTMLLRTNRVRWVFFRDSFFWHETISSPRSLKRRRCSPFGLVWWTSFIGITVLSRGGPFWKG